MRVNNKIDYKEEIIRYFDSGKQNIHFEVASPKLLFDALESLGAELDYDDFEPNGYDYDWHLAFSYKDKYFESSGSGYYGSADINAIVE